MVKYDAVGDPNTTSPFQQGIYLVRSHSTAKPKLYQVAHAKSLITRECKIRSHRTNPGEPKLSRLAFFGVYDIWKVTDSGALEKIFECNSQALAAWNEHKITDRELRDSINW